MRKIILKNVFAITIIAVIGISLSLGINSCKKEEETADKNYVLVIENGAQKINPDQSITYSAILIDKEGNVTEPTGVTWSTSDAAVASISTAGVISAAGEGMVTITASVTIDDVTLTAKAPLGVYLPSMFTVAPCAILYEVGGSIQL